MKTPATSFIWDEESLVRSALLELGIAHELLQEGTLAQGPSTVFYDHETATHWILIARISGCALASENGLIMVGYAKKEHNPASAERAITQFMGSMSGATCTRRKIPKQAGRN